MSKESINIVWIKRDIRYQDHAALHAAEQAGLPYLILFIFDKVLHDYKDYSYRHYQFQLQGLKQMQKTLRFYAQTSKFVTVKVPIFSIIFALIIK